MENIHERIKYRKCVFRDAKENPIETDISLPDYYPDVCRILSCTVDPYTETFYVEGDRLTLEGVACVRLLYASEDRQLNVYETEIRYTKATQYAEAEASDTLACTQKTVNVSFRAVGPRRVEVRATVSVGFNLFRLLELPIVEAAEEDIETLTVREACCSLHACFSGGFTVEEDFTPKEERLKNARIIGERTRVYSTEYKAVDNRILVKGYCDIAFLCLDTQSGEVFKDAESIPFSQIIEIFGLEDADSCLVLLQAEKYTLSFKDTGECAFSMRVSAQLLSGRDGTAVLTTDVFSGRAQMRAEYSECALTLGIQPFTETILLSKQTEAYEDAQASIEACGCSHLSAAASLADGQLILRGTASLYAVLRSSQGYQYVSRTADVEFRRDLAGTQNADVLHVLSCKAVTCTRNGDSLLFKAELDFSGAVLPVKPMRVVSACERTENAQDVSEDSIIGIYFAEPGERLWDIAKANRTALRGIREANAIEGDTLEAHTVLILPD